MKREQKGSEIKGGLPASGAVLAEVERAADAIGGRAEWTTNRRGGQYQVTRVLLRIEEAAEMLGLSKSKVYGMCQAGELPAVKIGTAVRIPVEELQAWIRANVVRGVA